MGGSDAALTDGTVVATARSGAAIWYNPACLTSVPTSAFDFSGSVYAMSLSRSDGELSLSTGEHSGGENFNFRVVPRTLSFATQLRPDVVFAVGVFNSVIVDSLLRADVSTSDGQAAYSLVTDNRGEGLHVAAAIGWKATRALSVGWALDVVYGGYQASAVLTSFNLGSSVTPYSFAEHQGWYLVGLQARFGVRYDFGSGYRIGAMLGSPSASLLRGIDILNTHAGPGDGTELTPYAAGSTQHAGGAFGQFEPGRVRLGIARDASRGWLALDGDLRFPMRSAVRLDTRWGGTARLGGIWQVASQWRVGGALVAALQQNAPLRTFGQSNTDYVGVNAGVDVSNRELKALARVRLSIALAVSYMFGWGQIPGVLGADMPDVSAPRLIARDQRVHDIAVNLAFKASR